MQFRLIAVDKIRSRYVGEACAEFRKRLRPYASYDEVELRPGDGANPELAMRDEAERALRLIRADERVWLLERTGTQFSSEDLARKLERAGYDGISRLTFVVAGAYGADALLRKRADFLWSLSSLTFLHEWARMIVLEQLYRAAKIARNEPYHH
ncbi:MAG: 23S rRNA (pseudouridine(1915)-N(3))-methyltransferase RlmH [Candidatus Baltobacteraceae bacterium]